MITAQNRATGSVSRLLSTYDSASLRERLAPTSEHLATLVPYSAQVSLADTATRWQMLPDCEQSRVALLDAQTVEHISCFQGNIENFIGTVKVPVGLAGPLRVNGLFAQGDYAIPLATTEAALVASYHRGAQLISEVGGCSAMLLDEAVCGAPGFAFRTLAECRMVANWVEAHGETLRQEASRTTRYGELSAIRAVIEG